METNSAPLKSSMFGGFKKKEVLSYIFELNESSQEEKQKLAEQIEELMLSREKLSARAAEMEQQITELMTDLDDMSVRLDDETRKSEQSAGLVEKLKAEIVRHESTIAQQNTELARHASINAELAEKNRGFEEKRRQVELAASQMADLLRQARQDADNVVDRAKLEAEEIVTNAKSSISIHIEEANKSVDGAYKKFGGFKSELETLHKTISDATFAISEKMQSLDDELDRIEKLVPEKLTEESLPTLTYKEDDENSSSDGSEKPAVAAVRSAASIAAEASDYTNDVLKRYGVRKDDSGFFRLAADK